MINFVSCNTTYGASINQDQLSLRINNGHYTLLEIAFSESFAMYVTRNYSAYQNDIWIGNVGRTYLCSQPRGEIYGVAIRDYSSSYAKLYYSVNCFGSVCLNTEVVNSYYIVQSSRNYTIGSSNRN